METITQNKLGRILCVDSGMLSKVLAGKARFSAKKALALEKQTGIEAPIWLYAETADLIACLEKKYGRINKKRGPRPTKPTGGTP